MRARERVFRLELLQMHANSSTAGVFACRQLAIVELLPSPLRSTCLSCVVAVAEAFEASDASPWYVLCFSCGAAASWPDGVLSGVRRDQHCRECHVVRGQLAYGMLVGRRCCSKCRFKSMAWPSRIGTLKSLRRLRLQLLAASRQRCRTATARACVDANCGCHCCNQSVGTRRTGEPLPRHGVCKHYGRSQRWLRFPCCGKVCPRVCALVGLSIDDAIDCRRFPVTCATTQPRVIRTSGQSGSCAARVLASKTSRIKCASDGLCGGLSVCASCRVCAR